MEAEASVLDDYVLSLAPAREPRICLLPTAGGDSEEQIRRFLDRVRRPPVRAQRTSRCSGSATRPVPLREHLLAQDVIYVGGGSMINLLALWRAHGLDAILREAWQAGIVLAGPERRLDVLVRVRHHEVASAARRRPPASASCPARTPCTTTASPSAARPTSRRSPRARCRPGYGVDDGVGLLFRGTRLAEVVAARAGAARLPRRRPPTASPASTSSSRACSPRGAHDLPGAVPHDIGELRLLHAARRRMAQD